MVAGGGGDFHDVSQGNWTRATTRVPSHRTTPPPPLRVGGLTRNVPLGEGRGRWLSFVNIRENNSDNNDSEDT